jgi:maltose alpha-D-glucosyltransferase / alpha-amylase
VPALGGAIEYHPHDSPEPTTIAMLQARVMSQADGWQHAVEELGRYFERVVAQMNEVDKIEVSGTFVDLADVTIPPLVLDTVGGYIETAATLGRRTGELHLALASDADSPAFAPEPFTEEDLAALIEAARRQGNTSLDLLETRLNSLHGVGRERAEKVLEQRSRVIGQLEAARGLNRGLTRTRVHGDLHLGQVLWVEGDFVFLDFEGEPARPLSERRAKDSPLRDMAGMLRSFNYAAFVGLSAFTLGRPEDLERLAPWARSWITWTSAVFLRTYRSTAGGASFLPSDSGQFDALLRLWMLHKALYELSYELNSRPDWVRIPLWGILSLTGGA